MSRALLSIRLLNSRREDILSMYNETFAEAMTSLLERTDTSHGDVHDSVFADVIPAFPLHPPFVDHEPREINIEGSKNIVNTDALSSQRCIVYAAGISRDSSFEQHLATHTRCQVHAFDCTIKTTADSVTGKAFQFHNWCLGRGG